MLNRILPPVFQLPGFRYYWLGIVLSQMGVRATLTANLWQVLQLTDSTLQVGLVGFFDAIALLVLSPLGGVIADRMDRRRLLQLSQAVGLLGSVGLTMLTFGGVIQPWHIFLTVLVISAAHTFDGPARVALIPALVPKERYVDAFALTNPTRELAVLLGPPIAGVLIALVGPGLVYAFNVVTYALLILFLALIKIQVPPPTDAVRPSVLTSIREGVAHLKARPIIWQMMSLDFSARFFGAYNVLLPSLARDILMVGPTGYGFLAAAPAAGAILGSGVAYRLRNYPLKGMVILGGTIAYALSCVGLAHSGLFILALAFGAGLGVSDAVAATYRQAVTQLETPDELRGRVTSLYQMVSRGAPSLGQAQMGALASVVGVPLGLTIGATFTFVYALSLAIKGKTVRFYGAEASQAT